MADCEKVFCQGKCPNGRKCERYLGSIGPTAIVQFDCKRKNCDKRITDIYRISLDVEEISNFKFTKETDKV